MKASCPGNLWNTVLTSWTALMTSYDLKENKLRLHVYQIKANNSGNLKIIMTSYYLLMTSK